MPLGSSGTVSLYNGSRGTVHLLADVVGYYRAGTATVAGAFTPLAPARVVDTRSGTGGPRARLAARGTLTFAVAGHGGVPASGVSAVVANVTAVAPAASGYLTAYAGDATRPAASTLNYAAGQTRANLATVRLGAAGDLAVYNGSAGAVDLVVDVSGYYLAGTPTEPGTYVAIDPERLLDTRAGGLPYRGPLRSGQAAHLFPDAPAAAASAVVLNGTVTQPTRSGYLAFQGDSEFWDGHFPVSHLNFVAHQTVANMVVVAPDSFLVYNRSAGTAQVIVDLEGYFLP